MNICNDVNKEKPEPDAFIVLDSAGDHVYSSPYKQFCHDHINDLLMLDIGVDGSFVVRGFYAEPTARKPITTIEIDHAYGEANQPSYLSFKAGVRYAEEKHGIKGQE